MRDTPLPRSPMAPQPLDLLSQHQTTARPSPVRSSPLVLPDVRHLPFTARPSSSARSCAPPIISMGLDPLHSLSPDDPECRCCPLSLSPPFLYPSHAPTSLSGALIISSARAPRHRAPLPLPCVTPALITCSGIQAVTLTSFSTPVDHHRALIYTCLLCSELSRPLYSCSSSSIFQLCCHCAPSTFKVLLVNHRRAWISPSETNPSPPSRG